MISDLCKNWPAKLVKMTGKMKKNSPAAGF